jgi:hypothetical protein
VKELSTKLSSGAFDLAQAPRTCRRAARQPPGELPIGVRRLPTGQCIGRNRPDVTRSPQRLGLSLASDEPGIFQTLEMNPYSARVKHQLFGKFFGARRPTETREASEQPSACRLGQRVAGTVAG